MRFSVLFALAAGTALAQSQSSSATSSSATLFTDLNGNKVVADSTRTSTTPTDKVQTRITQSLNGRQVPVEETEERVLRSDPSGTLTERIVRKYDPNGGLASTDRVVIEQRTQPGGGSTTQTTMYQSDLNGREIVTERRIAETKVSGTTTTTDLSIERPTVNGSFEIAEKRNAVTTGDKTKNSTVETVYRRSENGGLRTAVQTVTQATQTKDQTVRQTTEYEPTVNGAMELRSQSVATTTVHPDGTETSEVNLYGADAPGITRERGAPQQLQQQQIVTRKKAADGSVIETFSVRRPSVSDPTHLGSVEKVTETVCSGKCDITP